MPSTDPVSPLHNESICLCLPSIRAEALRPGGLFLLLRVPALTFVPKFEAKFILTALMSLQPYLLLSLQQPHPVDLFTLGLTSPLLSTGRRISYGPRGQRLHKRKPT